jgi:inhibitor of the pro-sigma K processing machinery
LDPILIISVLGGLILLLLFIGAPVKPFRLVGQVFVKVMIGALLLFFLNAFGSTFDLHIPINLATSTVSGLLGIPGIIALVVIETFIL